jgi:hypothetical protein
LGKLLINPAVRLDYFKFNYRDKLVPIYKTQTESEVKISPKLNFIYSQNNLQFFVKSGIGFHSNDARVVVQNNGKQVLPTAIGTDVEQFGNLSKVNCKFSTLVFIFTTRVCLCG